jgi:hypothetical protein
MLILTEFIARRELKPLRRYFELEDILDGGRKVLKNLADEVKSPQKLSGVKFYKVRIGRKTQGRMMVIMATDTGKVVPILIRLKKDKIFGMNMAMNNSVIVRQIDQNLERVLDDIQNKRYEEF